MLRKMLLVALILALSAVLPAVAGEGGCTAGTQECLDYMADKMRNKGYVGVRLEANETTGGYTVTSIYANSPAERAGFEVGDVLISLNGIKLAKENHEALSAEKQKMTPGSMATYSILRNGGEQKIDVTLEKIPEDVLAEWIGAHMLDHAEVALAKK